MQTSQPIASCAFCMLMVASFMECAGPVAAQVVPKSSSPRPSSSRGQVDIQRSRAYVFVGKSRLGHEHAVVGRLESGRIHLGARQNAGQLVFDMSSFAADTPEARKFIGLEGQTDASTRQQVSANMLGKDVLFVGHFPTATFTIASALPIDGPRGDHPKYRLVGQLTLHGVSHAVQIDAQADQQDDSIRLHGGFALLQTDYGIRPYSKAFGAVGVTNSLTVHGDIWISQGSLLPAAGKE